MFLVVGATGSLGGTIAKKLLAEGERVRVLVRAGSPARAGNPHTDPTTLKELGAETMHGDLREPRGLAAALRGVDVVVNTASGTKRAPPDTTSAIDATGTASLARAAAEAGVSRFVHVSAAGADPNAPEGLFRDKWLGEEAIKASGVPYVIVKPARYMRDWIGFVIGAQLQGAGGVVELVGDGTKGAAFVHEPDVAELVVRLARDPQLEPGQVLELASERATYPELVERIGRITGAPLSVRLLPIGGTVSTLPEPVNGLVSHLLTIHAVAPAYEKVERGVAERYGVELTGIDTFLKALVDA